MKESNQTESTMTFESSHAPSRSSDDIHQMTRGSLTMAWQGMSGTLFWVYTGAVLAVAYGTMDALIGLVLAAAFYSIVTAVVSRYAIANRTTVAEFSRTILGVKGAIITSIIFGLVAIYYALFEGQIVAYAFQATFGGETWVWNLVVVLYSTPLVLGGARRFMDKINGWLMPIYFLGLIGAVVWAGAVYGFGDAWMHHTAAKPLIFAAGGPGWLATFAGYLGAFVIVMYAMDFAALAKRKDSKFHLAVNFGPFFYFFGFGFNAIIGILLTFLIPGTQASGIGVAGGIMSLMGVLGLVVLFATQTRPNAINYYVAAANLQAFGNRVFRANLPNTFWVVTSAVLIYLLMTLPVIQYVLLALSWQGVLCAAWVSIAVTHVLLLRGKNEEWGGIPDSRYRQINASGLIAWSISTLIGVLALQIGVFIPELGHLSSTWSPIFTAVSAAAIYALLWNSPLKRTGLINEDTDSLVVSVR
ncbi:permease [Arthrobacter sp. OAP107]|uniref:purine-cytosine permease family protein n=1 Tax=Arthrobacter sp. OAP107 TaxID=3156445 RepID=UPI0033945008